jgi:hypothetical protein
VAGVVIREKMYLNLLEDDIVERLQSGTNVETLVWKYIAAKEHVLESRKVSRAKGKQKKPRFKLTLMALVIKEVIGPLPDPCGPIFLSNKYQSRCNDYVKRRSYSLLSTGLPLWCVQYRKRGNKRWLLVKPTSFNGNRKKQRKSKVSSKSKTSGAAPSSSDKRDWPSDSRN